MRKTTIPALLLLVAMALISGYVFGPVQAVAETPLAVLLSCHGDVKVVREDSAMAGSFGLALAVGDLITTGSDGEAEILFQDGNWIQVGSNSKMQVKGNRGGKPAAENETMVGEKSFEVVQNFLKLKSSEGTSSITALRSGGGGNEIHPLSPMQTKIRDARPTFRWRGSQPDLALRLTVYDNEDGVIWEHEFTGATSVTYPDDAPALVPGKEYSWTLESTDPLRFPPVRSQAAFFEILDESEQAGVSDALAKVAAESTPNEGSLHLIRASILYNHGLFQDAIDETKAAIEVQGENAALRSILARLYAEVGRTDEAMGEYNRLLETE
jgi:hypothetical protein